jgi:large subunit ribosomal protein L25
MEGKSLNAEVRSDFRKNACNRMRESGYIPSILYSHGKSEALKVKRKEFFNLFDGAISESVIFDLKITNRQEDADQMAFVKDYQIDPKSGDLLHIDFFKVTMDEKIHTHVHLDFVGSPKGVKLGGIMEMSERMVEVECLPRDLPSKIEVDISELLIGDSIHARDLNLGDKIHLMTNPDSVLVSVHMIKAAKVAAVSEEEVAVEGQAESTDIEDNEKK